jgi:hypothetical protein
MVVLASSISDPISTPHVGSLVANLLIHSRRFTEEPAFEPDLQGEAGGLQADVH